MIQRLIRSHPLIAFFVLAYVFAWVSIIPRMAAAGDPKGPSTFAIVSVFALGATAPTLAAFIVVAIERGRMGVRDLIAQLFRWRVGLRWWVIALIIYPAPIVVGIAVQLISEGTIDWKSPESPDKYVSLWLFVASVPVLALLEETGWRGYALPTLQKRFNPLVSTLILGILWACWHLPMFYVQGSAQEGIPFFLYVVVTTLTATWITWLYNHTQSILLVAVLHASANFSLFLPGSQGEIPVVGMVRGGLSLLITIAIVFEGRMTKLRAAQPQR